MAILNPGSEGIVTSGPSAYERSGLALESWRRLAARTESPIFGFPRRIIDRRPNIIAPPPPTDGSAPIIGPRAPDVVPVVPPPAIPADAPVPGARPAAAGGAPLPSPVQAGVPWWLALVLIGLLLADQ